MQGSEGKYESAGLQIQVIDLTFIPVLDNGIFQVLIWVFQVVKRDVYFSASFGHGYFGYYLAVYMYVGKREYLTCITVEKRRYQMGIGMKNFVYLDKYF